MESAPPSKGLSFRADGGQAGEQWGGSWHGMAGLDGLEMENATRWAGLLARCCKICIVK